MKRRVAFRGKRQNKLSMFLVMTVVLMLLVVVGIKSMELHAKQENYNLRKADLEKQIVNEETRTEELEEFKKYAKTKKYVEEIAKDKLGLVYEEEIIFKSEE